MAQPNSKKRLLHSSVSAEDESNNSDLATYLFNIQNQSIRDGSTLDQNQLVKDLNLGQADIFRILTSPQPAYVQLYAITEQYLNENEHKTFTTLCQELIRAESKLALALEDLGEEDDAFETADEEFEDSNAKDKHQEVRKIEKEVERIQKEITKLLEDAIAKGYESLTVELILQLTPKESITAVKQFLTTQSVNRKRETLVNSNIFDRPIAKAVHRKSQENSSTTKNDQNNNQTQNNANNNSSNTNQNGDHAPIYQAINYNIAQSKLAFDQNQVLISALQQSSHDNQQLVSSLIQKQNFENNKSLRADTPVPIFNRNEHLNQMSLLLFLNNNWKHFLFMSSLTLQNSLNLLPKSFNYDAKLMNDVAVTLADFAGQIESGHESSLKKDDFARVAEKLAICLPEIRLDSRQIKLAKSKIVLFEIRRNMLMLDQVNYLKKNLIMIENSENPSSEAELVQKIVTAISEDVAGKCWEDQGPRFLQIQKDCEPAGTLATMTTYQQLKAWAIDLDKRSKSKNSSNNNAYQRVRVKNDDDMDTNAISALERQFQDSSLSTNAVSRGPKTQGNGWTSRLSTRRRKQMLDSGKYVECARPGCKWLSRNDLKCCAECGDPLPKVSIVESNEFLGGLEKNNNNSDVSTKISDPSLSSDIPDSSPTSEIPKNLISPSPTQEAPIVKNTPPDADHSEIRDMPESCENSPTRSDYHISNSEDLGEAVNLMLLEPQVSLESNKTKLQGFKATTKEQYTNSIRLHDQFSVYQNQLEELKNKFSYEEIDADHELNDLLDYQTFALKFNESEPTEQSDSTHKSEDFKISLPYSTVSSTTKCKANRNLAFAILNFRYQSKRGEKFITIPNKILVDGGSEGSFLPESIYSVWKEKDPTLTLVEDKIRHLSFSDHTLNVIGIVTVPLIFIKDDFGEIHPVRNASFRVIKDAKFAILGQDIRASLERDSSVMLNSVASRGVAKFMRIDSVESEMQKAWSNAISSLQKDPKLESTESEIESLIPPVIESNTADSENSKFLSNEEFETVEIQDKSFKIGKNRSSKFKAKMKEILQSSISCFDGTFSKFKVEPWIIQFKEGKLLIPKKYLHLSDAMQKIMKQKIKDLLEKDMVEPTTRLPNAALFLVDKCNGCELDSPNRWRLVASFVTLNEFLVPMSYNLPPVAHIFEEAVKSSVFFKTDVVSGFFNIPIKCSGDNQIVCSAAGLPQNYSWKVLPMGLSVSSQIFSMQLDEIFYEIRNNLAKYIDDLMGHHENEEGLLRVIRKFFDLCLKYNIRLSSEKSVFGVDSIEFLSRRIAHGRVTINDEHRRNIDKLDGTKIKRETLIGYLRHFQNFIRDPKLIETITNGKNWDNDKEVALGQIKEILKKAEWKPIYSKNKVLLITSDANDFGYATYCAITTKDADNQEKISMEQLRCMEMIDMHSKSMHNEPAWKNSTIYSKELLALAKAIEKYRYYIQSSKSVLILVDNRAVHDSKRSSVFKIRNIFESIRIMHPNIRIALVKGANNQISDILSRYNVKTSNKEGTPDNYFEKSYDFSEILKKADFVRGNRSKQYCNMTWSSSIDYQDFDDTYRSLFDLCEKEVKILDDETCTKDAILVNSIVEPDLNRQESNVRDSREGSEAVSTTETTCQESGESKKSNNLEQYIKDNFGSYSFDGKSKEESIKLLADGFYENLSEKDKQQMWARIAHRNTGCCGPKVLFDMMKDFLGDKLLLSLRDCRNIIGSCSCYTAKTSKNSMLTVPTDCNRIAYMDFKEVNFEYKNKKYKKEFISFSERLSGIRICVPVRGQTGLDALMLLSFCCQVFGFIEEVKTDNAKCFSGEVFNNFCDYMGIRHSYTLVQNPQSNYAEILHKSINKMTRNNLMISHETILPRICKNLMARNASRSEISKKSAYEILFGHQKPIDPNSPTAKTGASALEVQREAFEKFSKSKMGEIPKSVQTKSYEKGDAVIAEYKNGNKMITVKGHVHRVHPNYIEIKYKNGKKKSWAYRYVRHVLNPNKIIDANLST